MSSTERDAFSVGVIILEVLVGTELVLLATDHINLKMLFDVIKHCLDDKTKDLLNYMLFFDTQVSFDCYASSDAEKMQLALLKTIKHVKHLHKYSYALSQMAAMAKDNFQVNSKKNQDNYGIKVNK